MLRIARYKKFSNPKNPKQQKNKEAKDFYRIIKTIIKYKERRE